jgi:hypothetical protein
MGYIPAFLAAYLGLKVVKTFRRESLPVVLHL